MSRNLTVTEKHLDERLGNAGCNDYQLPATPENKKLMTQVIQRAYAPQDQIQPLKDLESSPDHFLTMDFLVLGYLRKQVMQLPVSQD